MLKSLQFPGHRISFVEPTPWEATKFRAMGTECSVVVIDGPLGLAGFAEREVMRCEARWSRFRGDSELCRLNAAAGHGYCTLSHDTFALIERAVTLWRATDGWFDPTVFDALIAAGYDASFEVVRTRAPFQRRTSAERAPGCRGIEFAADGNAVLVPAGVHLDLGGIGKGFAADMIAERVIERGARGVCVELGGDVRVLGIGPEGRKWSIEVEDPFDEDRPLFTETLDDDAIVTSTRLFRRWTTNEGTAHHLIDPRTGMPSTAGVAAVVARARDASYAEAIAKAVLVAGPRLGLELAQRSAASCWLVLDDRRVVVAKRTEAASC
ncbi:MAG: FAD:protein FMN transferase [Acidimicrobiales bacterium]